MPEFLTCTHEESAVGMAHGYFKIAGKPLMTLCHGTVGLQHATHGDLQCLVRPRAGDRHRRQRSRRRPSAAGRADRSTRRRTSTRIVRDYTKWDDTPVRPAALRAVVRARLQDRDDAALRAGGDLARCRPAAGADQGQRREALHSALRGELAAPGRYRRGEGSGAAARQRAKSGDRRRSCGAHRERHAASGRSSPSSCRRGWSIRAAA